MNEFVAKITNNDIDMGSGQRVETVSGAAELTQSTAYYMNTNEGEWHLNSAFGFPWLTPTGSAVKGILGERFDEDYLMSQIISQLKYDPRIEEVKSKDLTLNLATRQLVGKITFKSTLGVDVEVDVDAGGV